jgi:hypothetical protein
MKVVTVRAHPNKANVSNEEKARAEIARAEIAEAEKKEKERFLMFTRVLMK